MSGAEIEYAVNEALFEAYKRDQHDHGVATQNRLDKFDAFLLGETVRACRERALYSGAALTDLLEMEKTAQANRWIFI